LQLRTSMLPIFCLAMAGTVTARAAETELSETDVSRCPTNKQWQNAYNKGDAMAVADLYALGGIEVTPEGIGEGRAAIKERVQKDLEQEKLRNLIIVATKCDVEESFRWSSGRWKADSPHGEMRGFWTAIEAKDGDVWKIHNLTYNLTPPPAGK
jgi:ketosteroid isomerase-like protein